MSLKPAAGKKSAIDFGNQVLGMVENDGYVVPQGSEKCAQAGRTLSTLVTLIVGFVFVILGGKALSSRSEYLKKNEQATQNREDNLIYKHAHTITAIAAKEKLGSGITQLIMGLGWLVVAAAIVLMVKSNPQIMLSHQLLYGGGAAVGIGLLGHGIVRIHYCASGNRKLNGAYNELKLLCEMRAEPSPGQPDPVLDDRKQNVKIRRDSDDGQPGERPIVPPGSLAPEGEPGSNGLLPLPPPPPFVDQHQPTLPHAPLPLVEDKPPAPQNPSPTHVVHEGEPEPSVASPLPPPPSAPLPVAVAEDQAQPMPPPNSPPAPPPPANNVQQGEPGPSVASPLPPPPSAPLPVAVAVDQPQPMPPPNSPPAPLPPENIVQKGEPEPSVASPLPPPPSAPLPAVAEGQPQPMQQADLPPSVEGPKASPVPLPPHENLISPIEESRAKAADASPLVPSQVSTPQPPVSITPPPAAPNSNSQNAQPLAHPYALVDHPASSLLTRDACDAEFERRIAAYRAAKEAGVPLPFPSNTDLLARMKELAEEEVRSVQKSRPHSHVPAPAVAQPSIEGQPQPTPTAAPLSPQADQHPNVEGPKAPPALLPASNSSSGDIKKDTAQALLAQLRELQAELRRRNQANQEVLKRPLKDRPPIPYKNNSDIILKMAEVHQKMNGLSAPQKHPEPPPAAAVAAPSSSSSAPQVPAAAPSAAEQAPSQSSAPQVPVQMAESGNTTMQQSPAVQLDDATIKAKKEYLERLKEAITRLEEEITGTTDDFAMMMANIPFKKRQLGKFKEQRDQTERELGLEPTSKK